MAGNGKAASDDYVVALADLTFNSKPMINVLTMLAEENAEHGHHIVQAIAARIKSVAIDQKLPALYLMDSILKNVGGNYVSIISENIIDVFTHVFKMANDERKRMQLFKLRNTWLQYFQGKILHELDVEVNRIDPNWPVLPVPSEINVVTSGFAVLTSASPTLASVPACLATAISLSGANVHCDVPADYAVASEISNSIGLKKIHVNPKFLRQVTDAATNSNTAPSLIVSIAEKHINILDESPVEVQQDGRQLKVENLPHRKLDLSFASKQQESLVKQQLEREKLLYEQKQQISLLRKQQEDLSARDFTEILPSHALQKQNDPRLRQDNSAACTANSVLMDKVLFKRSGVRNAESIASSSCLMSKPFKPYARSYARSVNAISGAAKDGSPVGLLNKIMSSLHTTRTRAVKSDMQSSAATYSQLVEAVAVPSQTVASSHSYNTSATASEAHTASSSSDELQRPDGRAADSITKDLASEATKAAAEGVFQTAFRSSDDTEHHSGILEKTPSASLSSGEACISTNMPLLSSPIGASLCDSSASHPVRVPPAVPMALSVAEKAFQSSNASFSVEHLQQLIASTLSANMKDMSSKDIELAVQAAAIATAMQQLEMQSNVQAGVQTVNIPSGEQQRTLAVSASISAMVFSPSLGSTTSSERTSSIDLRQGLTFLPPRILQAHGTESQANLSLGRASTALTFTMQECKTHSKPLLTIDELPQGADVSKNSNQSDSLGCELEPPKLGQTLSLQRASLQEPLSKRAREDSGIPLEQERAIKSEMEDPREKSRKARARSPSRYYNLMERKIESGKGLVTGRTNELVDPRRQGPIGESQNRVYDSLRPNFGIKGSNPMYDMIMARLNKMEALLPTTGYSGRTGHIQAFEELASEVIHLFKESKISCDQKDILLDRIDFLSRQRPSSENEEFQESEFLRPISAERMPSGARNSDALFVKPYRTHDFHDQPTRETSWNDQRMLDDHSARLERPLPRSVALDARPNYRVPSRPMRRMAPILSRGRSLTTSSRQSHSSYLRLNHPQQSNPYGKTARKSQAQAGNQKSTNAIKVPERWLAVESGFRDQLDYSESLGHSSFSSDAIINVPKESRHDSFRRTDRPQENAHSPSNVLDRKTPPLSSAVGFFGHRDYVVTDGKPDPAAPSQPLEAGYEHQNVSVTCYPPEFNKKHSANTCAGLSVDKHTRESGHEFSHISYDDFNTFYTGQPSSDPRLGNSTLQDTRTEALRSSFPGTSENSHLSHSRATGRSMWSRAANENFNVPDLHERWQDLPVSALSAQSSQLDQSGSVDVLGLIGQLSAAGILPQSKFDAELPKIKAEVQICDNQAVTVGLSAELGFGPAEVAEALSPITLALDDLKQRRDSVIRCLFCGVQCSACGQRFWRGTSEQYKEHLDWHFRQNKKGKHTDRRMISRPWFSTEDKWLQFDDLPEHGGKQSPIQKIEPQNSDSDESASSPLTESRSYQPECGEELFVCLVTGNENDDFCAVCLEPFEQFWDEDREEWMYKKAIRRNNKTYHYRCFKDHMLVEERGNGEEAGAPPGPEILVGYPEVILHDSASSQLPTDSLAGKSDTWTTASEFTTTKELDVQVGSFLGKGPLEGLQMSEAISESEMKNTVGLSSTGAAPEGFTELSENALSLIPKEVV